MRFIKPSFSFGQHLEYAQMLHLVGTAISNCYNVELPTDQKGREIFIGARIKSGHESVIEHAGFSVNLTVDRGITHELVRHRLMSPTQESTRYCDYSKERNGGGHLTFIMPPFMSAVIPEGSYLLYRGPGNAPNNPLVGLIPDIAGGREQIIPLIAPSEQIWAQTMEFCESAYLQAVKSEAPGPFMPNQIARGLLPNALKAKITITANMREWRHIFRVRAIGTTGAPHPQMTEIMDQVLLEARRRFPVFFKDL